MTRANVPQVSVSLVFEADLLSVIMPYRGSESLLCAILALFVVGFVVFACCCGVGFGGFVVVQAKHEISRLLAPRFSAIRRCLNTIIPLSYDLLLAN